MSQDGDVGMTKVSGGNRRSGNGSLQAEIREMPNPTFK
jgi:hypothetical protein